MAVQTGASGGKQHTIRFAREAGRRILSPRPTTKAELGAAQNAGIFALIDAGEATAFVGSDIPRIVDELVADRARLVAGETPAPEA